MTAKKLISTINKNTPIWFRKIKKGVTLLSDATIIIMLGVGYSEDSLILLVIRVGISAIMNTVEIFLTDEPDA
tara:strand:+ start:633 stop:851 length:219 start_codon:yes stop_codon:yes gene_type:complete